MGYKSLNRSIARDLWQCERYKELGKTWSFHKRLTVMERNYKSPSVYSNIQNFGSRWIVSRSQMINTSSVDENQTLLPLWGRHGCLNWSNTVSSHKGRLSRSSPSIKPETLVSLKALPVWYVCSVDVVCVYSSSLNIVPIVATWNIDTCVCISVCCIWSVYELFVGCASVCVAYSVCRVKYNGRSSVLGESVLQSKRRVWTPA